MFVSSIYEECEKILGTSDQPRVFRALTQAVQALMERGHWFNTQAEMDICSGWDGCTVTLPKEVGTPLAVNVDGSPTYFRGRYFQYHVNGGGQFSPVPWAWDDRGMTPVLMDPRAPSELVAFAELQSDAGKTLRVLGVGEDGRELVSQSPSGVANRGLVVPIRPKADLAGGQVMLPDGVRLSGRDSTVSRVYDLTASEPHDLVTGAVMRLTLLAGAAASGFVDKNYFVRAVDEEVVRVYLSRLAAQNDVGAVPLDSFDSSTQFKLRDARPLVVKTQLTCGAAHHVTVAAGAVVTAATLPLPLLPGKVSYVSPLDETHLQLYATLDDAQKGVNPVYLTTPGASVVARLRRLARPVTLLTSSVAHALVTGDAVYVSNTGGELPQPLQAGATYYARVVSSVSISIHLTKQEAIDGTSPVALTTVGSGTNTFFKLLPATAALGNSNNISCPNHNLPLSSNTAIRFSCDGTYPTPLDGATAYYAYPGGNVNGFTVRDSSSNAITITAVGAGTLYVALSRAFSVTFDDSWETDSSVVSTGDALYPDADALLPTTSPAIDANTPVYVRVIGTDRVELYDTEAHAEAAPSSTGRIAMVALGQGDAYLERAVSVTVEPLDSTLVPTPVGFMSSGVTVQLETNGTLPSPLATGTDYEAVVEGDSVTLRDGGGDITLTDVGSGTHRLVIERVVTPSPSTTLSIPRHALSTGDALAMSGDVPPPLSDSTTYYARWVSPDLIEVYDTQAHARDLAHTTGRVAFYVADGTTFTVSGVYDPTLVRAVTAIDKPETVGSVTLYAWDPRNSDELTLLGVYGPRERNPSYRRIRLGKKCAWVRVLYKVQAPKVESLDDFIPIEQERAVLMAVRAIDLENKNFIAQAASYWTVAAQYLLNQHESNVGHAGEPPQVQVSGYSMGEGPVIM